MDIKVRQREKKIIEYIAEHGTGTVSELSNAFCVSEITIRRDLSRLAEEKVLKRYHGGAKLHIPTNAELKCAEFQQKSTLMLDEKRRIGNCACSFIKDNDIVFMNSGTTVLQFLTQLEKQGVTIVTSNAAAFDCPINPGVEILALGGNYDSRTRSMCGEFTINNIMGIYSTCTILGANGLDVKEGMTTSVYQECTINNAMINHTKGKVILLADSTKIGKISSYVSSPLSKIDVIITDINCPETYIDGFHQQNVEVIVV